MRRFQRGLDEIKKATSRHAIRADLWAREIVELEAKEEQDREEAEKIRANQCRLEDENKVMTDLEALYDEVTKYWPDIKFHRNIGQV